MEVQLFNLINMWATVGFDISLYGFTLVGIHEKPYSYNVWRWLNGGGECIFGNRYFATPSEAVADAHKKLIEWFGNHYGFSGEKRCS